MRHIILNLTLVDLVGRIRKNEMARITVFYEGQPQKAARPPWDGGFVWKKDKDGNPWIGVACELDGASLWWPVKDHLSDEPDSLQINVTIPEGFFCVSNGKLQQRIKENGRETFVWKTLYPINTYNATIYIGNFKHFTLPYKKQDSILNLDFYVLTYNLDKAKSHFQQASEIIRFYEMRFGDYPWWNEGYKLVESPYKGMENQTAIAYGNDYKNWIGKNFDYIILHETAHEWWGNSVSASDYAEIWLHEGFATYSEALYVEHTEGYNAYLKYLNFYSLLIRNKQPLIGPFDVNYWKYRDGDVYFKGALLLHTLRNVIDNDSLFFDIIRTFYHENKYTVTSTKNFIELVNRMTGQDYGWFFGQYLYNRACPQLEWQYGPDKEDRSYELYYRWGNVNADFKLPVTVDADGKSRIIYPTSEIQVLKLSTGDPVTLNLFNSYIALKERFNLNPK